MTIIDIPSMAVVGLPAVCAGISARFGQETMPRISAILIPTGLAGTTIGMVQILQQMDDPSHLGPALFVASLCSIYAAGAKLTTDRGLKSKLLPHPSKPNPVLSSISFYLFMIVMAMAIGYGGTIISFVDIYAFSIIGIAMLAIKFAPGTYRKVGFLPASIRIIPLLGIAVLFSCNALVWLKLDDPTAIGPIMAIGLLTSLYANLYWVSAVLLYPHRAQRNSNGAQWTMGGLNAFGLAASFLPVWLVFS